MKIVATTAERIAQLVTAAPFASQWDVKKAFRPISKLAELQAGQLLKPVCTVVPRRGQMSRLARGVRLREIFVDVAVQVQIDLDEGSGSTEDKDFEGLLICLDHVADLLFLEENAVLYPGTADEASLDDAEVTYMEINEVGTSRVATGIITPKYLSSKVDS